MEKKEIYLVLVNIWQDGKVTTDDCGERDPEICPYRVSTVWKPVVGNGSIIKVPLWFTTKEAAQEFTEKANSETERTFYLIQEFSYHCETIKDEAKIIFPVKSDSWPVLDEGKTERAPGVWASVRSFFICDKTAAEGYVRRFNEDATAASKIVRQSNGDSVSRHTALRLY